MRSALRDSSGFRAVTTEELTGRPEGIIVITEEGDESGSVGMAVVSARATRPARYFIRVQ